MSEQDINDLAGRTQNVWQDQLAPDKKLLSIRYDLLMQ